MTIFWFFVFGRKMIQVVAATPENAIDCLEAVYGWQPWFLMVEEQQFHLN